MNIRDIQGFVTAVDLGSIQRAAARLHLTQPGISFLSVVADQFGLWGV